MGTPFTARVEGSGSRPIVRAVGEIDLASATEFESVVATVDRSVGELELDMAEVSFIDSSGLAVISRLVQQFDRVVVSHPSSMLRQLLDLTGLDGLVEIRS